MIILNFDFIFFVCHDSYTMRAKLSKKEAKLFKDRWNNVNKFQSGELKSIAIVEKYQQLLTLMTAKRIFNIRKKKHSIIKQWQILRKLYENE